MQIIVDTYEERKSEIELYFLAVNQLYQVKDTLDDEEKLEFHKEDFIKISKSNILLMIYNLVESTVMGGIALEDVKEKRNQLAHGTLSFVECGRDYSLDDLEKIKNETNIFLYALLLDMKQYYDEQKFKTIT